MIFNRKFPFIKQYDYADCGIACLRMVAKFYGRTISSQDIEKFAVPSKTGLSIQQLSSVADRLGFRSLGVQVAWSRLKDDIPLPVIVHWQRNHFVVLYKIKGERVYVADSKTGLCDYPVAEFLDNWLLVKNNGASFGLLLVLEPSPAFYDQEESKVADNKASLHFILRNVFKYKLHFSLLIAGLFLGSLLQLLIPFVTQSIVDLGVIPKDIHFIQVIIMAQLMLFLSITVVEYLRTWILIHLSSRLNVFIISDFLSKLMNLPLDFFDTKTKGDLMQRIQDHERVRIFLTDTCLKSMFSVFSVIVLWGVLAVYSYAIFTAFFVLTALEMMWIFIFLHRVRQIDNESFALMGEEQGKLYEIITGIAEIKLYNIEQRKRWEWENIQARLFKVNLKRLRLNHRQEGMAKVMHYLLIIVVNLITAMHVVEGKLSLGAMLAVTSILGLLNVPISQLINFILRGHIAKMSLERMAHIHSQQGEDEMEGQDKIIPQDKTLTLQHVSFRFNTDQSNFELKDVTLEIPEGKITAIAGLSGSGKTTLIKLLLKFYNPSSGTILIGNKDLRTINNAYWRSHCGAVLQDGLIFSDTIENNIALAQTVDHAQLIKAAEIANIHEFIESLPQGYKTKIGQDGLGLSQGQKQRIIIARAVYRNPEFLFFDEATNALDAKNEEIIMRNLQKFFHKKTVVIIAHRLSTIRNADQIIIVEGGRIVEAGDHQTLIGNRKKYFALVESQMSAVSSFVTTENRL